MNKFDYEALMEQIRLLEMKSQKIELEKDYLKCIKPSILEIQERKNWNIKKENLLKEAESISNSLSIAYADLEKIFK